MGGKTGSARMVAAIGGFDGVHLGHQALLRRVTQAAAREGALPGVVTFDPLPLQVLTPEDESLLLTLSREKTSLLAEFGIQRILLLQFTRQMAALSAREFLKQVVLRELDPVSLVVGHDFRFGADRQGDVAMLRSAGCDLGFRVEEVAAVCQGGMRISSTSIREQIRQGRVSEATRLLGHALVVEGRVVPGRGIGGRCLVPTANMEVDSDQLLPAPGVYLVEAEIDEGRFTGVVNRGQAPTLGTGHDRLTEVHLLDYQGDLLGRTIRISFLEWLREARRFPDLASLKRAIQGDLLAARHRFGHGFENHLVSCP
ncbi:MAG: riboflavin biosynthesis protein RibF [Candidatus Eisenbacteria sp.]|nr:riboflavin biosynthesis protein RibF [Candidatus Eisenbacteria bacterium]